MIKMCWYKIYVDIIGPLICSLIGGLLTVLGVYLTIRYEKKKDKDVIKFNSKPLFYRLDRRQDYDYKNAKNYYLNDNNKSLIRIFGTFHNTDKAYLILNYASINNKKYFPINGNVIDKDEVFNLYIDVSEKLKNDKELVLVIKDVYDNTYEYIIEYKNDEKGYAEIENFKEKKHKLKFGLRTNKNDGN